METDQRIQSDLAAFREALQQQSRARLSTRVRRALDCIHEHLFDERLSVAFVRRRCELHDHTVSSPFKHEMGVGSACHMDTAKRLPATQNGLCYDAWDM